MDCLNRRTEYELIDFGNGRRLERFGPVVLDRPWPAVADIEPQKPQLWHQADARFEGPQAGRGRWVFRRPLPETWAIELDGLRLRLKPTPWGQVGLFPEQRANWRWIRRVLGQPAANDKTCHAAGHTAAAQVAGPWMRVLNLFAYTGGSTLAAAACGAEVVHVDAAANIVSWARQNAALSGLEGRQIRWIVEDAQKFVRRELRRGNKYEGVILDPPSYGHGPHGEVWRLSKHLRGLLERCAELLAERARLLVLSCHTPRYGPARLKALVAEALGTQAGQIEAGPLEIRTRDGRAMPCGQVVRWCDVRQG